MKRKRNSPNADVDEPTPKRRKVSRIATEQILETVIGVDIETVHIGALPTERKIFAVGIAVGHLVKELNGEPVLKMSERRRFSTFRPFPEPESSILSSYTFWKANKETYLTLLSEAVPEARMATHVHLTISDIHRKFPGARLISDFASFDIGILNAFLGHFSFPTLEFIPMENSGRPYRFATDLDTSSFTRGYLSALNPANLKAKKRWERILDHLCVPPEERQCPYEHTHLPDDDAAKEVWQYLLARKWMMKRSAEDESDSN